MVNERIVVTGVGAVSPLGLGRAELWRGLVEARVAVGAFDLFEIQGVAFGTLRRAVHFIAPPIREGQADLAIPAVYIRVMRNQEVGEVERAGRRKPVILTDPHQGAK